MLSIILAAGKGTRMKSNLPKVMHKVNGIPMIERVMKTTSNFGENLLVLGHKKEIILEAYPDIKYVIQNEQLGTAHAIMISKEHLKNHNQILVTYGDGPLLSTDTISEMKEKFEKENLDCLILTCVLDNPKGYGRIIKDDNEKVIDIIEENEASEDIKKINEINVGVYIFKSSSLLSIIDDFKNDNNKGEYYLTDAVKLLNSKNLKVKSLLLKDKNEMIGVNSKYDLYTVENILRQKKLKELLENGVIIHDINSTYIEDDVIIGQDTEIYPNTIIKGNTIIGENCIIYSSRIINSHIASNVKIEESIVEYSKIENDVTIGPFAHLRKGTNLLEKVHIGNFVEIKNSTLAENVKCGHLTYIGDSSIGKETNIGAGTITCNYDGKQKHKTTIGENCFIGSNTIMVSPLNIGENVLTAAGSVITKNVESNSIAFGRSRQTIIKKNMKESVNDD